MQKYHILVKMNLLAGIPKHFFITSMQSSNNQYRPKRFPWNGKFKTHKNVLVTPLHKVLDFGPLFFHTTLVHCGCSLTERSGIAKRITSSSTPKLQEVRVVDVTLYVNGVYSASIEV